MSAFDDVSPISSNSTDDWELLKIPTLLRCSPNQMDTSPENTDIETEPRNERNRRLCGYLMKFGDKALIKTWKKRWFVYEPCRCVLYYYHRPQDIEPLGNIDISNASFNICVDDKFGFEISCRERTYHLQAPDRKTMMFWLQELQAHRRASEAPRGSLDSTNGLLGEVKHSEPDDMDKTCSIDREKVEQPDTIGEHSALVEKLNPWNFSFSNWNAEFKNWKKNTFNPITGEPSRNGQISMARSNVESKIKIDNSVFLQDNHTSCPAKNKPYSDYNLASCQECEEKESTISVLRKAMSVAHIEIQSRDEVIKSLSEQLSLATTNKKRDKSYNEEVSEDQEQYILQLTRMIENFKRNIADLKDKMQDKDVLIEELKQKETVFKEMIHAKDDSIISLTNKLDTVEKCEEVAVSGNTDVAESVKIDYQNLIDTCDALSAQNAFLNKEILELSKLRKANTEKLNSNTEKLCQKEAEFVKLKSRYLFFLKEFSSPRRGNSSDNISPDILEHLIDEAINEQGDSAEKCRSLKPKTADRYGFYNEFDEGDLTHNEIMKENFDDFSVDYDEDIPLEISVKVKWENYLVSQGNMAITRTEELKLLVRQGIPHQYRAQVWKDLLFLRIDNERNLVEDGYYTKLLKNKEGTYSPSAKQIELDLLRTLPNNRYYENVNSEGTSKLRRVLLAYSWHNPTVGYCQGLNRLGAIILLYLDEETAFWALVAIVECLMPADYFSRSLLGAQIDQRVLRELLEEKFPRLGAHLQDMHFDLSLISFNWFLTIFVDFFPIELMLRVWDTFFFEGSKVLFRYALAIFKLFEDDILKHHDPGPVFDFFRKVPKSRFNTQKVFHIAFAQLNPFSRKVIESKRRFYRPLMQAQLDEFEVLRQVYREKRENNKEEVLISDDDN